jgi:hypothetical protein
MPITRRGAPAGSGVEHLSLTEGFTELALSPDGKKVAVIVRGEIFAASAKDGGDAARVTDTPGNEFHVTWSPDSRRLVYASDREGVAHLYQYDFATSAEARHQRRRGGSLAALLSGRKLVAFVRGDNQVRLLDVGQAGACSRKCSIARRSQHSPLAWSPDSRWIASEAERKDSPTCRPPAAVGSANRAISFLAPLVPARSRGAVTARRMVRHHAFPNCARVVRIVCSSDAAVRETSSNLFRENMFGTAHPPAPKPETGHRPRRASRRARHDQLRNPTARFACWRRRHPQDISPDGRRCCCQRAPQCAVPLHVLDRGCRERGCAAAHLDVGRQSHARFSPDGGTCLPRTGTRQRDHGGRGNHRVNAPLTGRRLRARSSRCSRRGLPRDNFWEPKMNGVDWSAVRAVHAARRRRRDRGGAPPAEPDMASQLLAHGRQRTAGARPAIGSSACASIAGVREERPSPHLQVIGRPGAVAGIKPAMPAAGEGQPVGPRVGLDALLAHTINRRIDLVISSDAGGGSRRSSCEPVISNGEERLYRRVEARRAYVAKASGDGSATSMFVVSGAARDRSRQNTRAPWSSTCATTTAASSCAWTCSGQNY